MSRFSMNRWWALLLALGLFTACLFLLSSATMPTPARADGSGSQLLPSEPVPGGYGDPDVPIGPGQGKGGKTVVITRGGCGVQVNEAGVRTAGDGRTPLSVVVTRLRLFLASLRGFYLRF
ncbi:MAG TPA: hypothetical protein VMS88_04260 [Terriglobales bacterium]|nr:hypothetical protein [Terriglobales bacterium]